MMNLSRSSTTPLRPSILDEAPPQSGRTKVLLAIISGLAFLGFADAAYLTADHYFSLPLPCTVTHGCETVLTSPYSMVGPIPLATLGIWFYLTAFFSALYLYAKPRVSRNQAFQMVLLTSIGLMCSIVFEAIQAFIIHAFCLYCLASAIITVLLFVCGAALWLGARRERPVFSETVS